MNRIHPLIPTLLCLFLVTTLVTGCDEKTTTSSSRGTLPFPSSPSEPGLGLQAELGGRYVRSIRIRSGDWSAIGANEAVRLTLEADGMAEARQFEIDLELEPISAFVIGESSFEPAEPWFTFLSGIEPVAGSDNRIKSGGAYLTNTEYVSGDAQLGTINLVTSPNFDAQTQVTIRVVFFSVGPNSGTRDNFYATDLNMGLIVNGP